MPKNIIIKLASWEMKELKKPEGDGGHQAFHRWLYEKLQEDGSMEFSDEEFGRLVRHMGYGGGGFQGRLRKIFARPISELLGLR